jgi:hypothetical protein
MRYLERSDDRRDGQYTMDIFACMQQRGCGDAQLTTHQNATYNCFDLKNQQSFTTSDNTTKMPMISPLDNLSAMSATFSIAELLEQILRYLPASQLVRSKATCRNFCNAIEISPTLRRKTSTFLRLGDVDENDLFTTNAGGDVVFSTRSLEPLAFFYPSEAERRLFVRFSVANSGWLEKARKANGFGRLVVVDQPLSDVKVGWHCDCFAEMRAEVKLSCHSGMVTFGDVLRAMKTEHRTNGHGGCGSVVKFWLDGLWKRSEKVMERGC